MLSGFLLALAPSSWRRWSARSSCIRTTPTWAFSVRLVGMAGLSIRGGTIYQSHSPGTDGYRTLSRHGPHAGPGMRPVGRDLCHRGTGHAAPVPRPLLRQPPLDSPPRDDDRRTGRKNKTRPRGHAGLSHTVSNTLRTASMPQLTLAVPLAIIFLPRPFPSVAALSADAVAGERAGRTHGLFRLVLSRGIGGLSAHFRAVPAITFLVTVPIVAAGGTSMGRLWMAGRWGSPDFLSGAGAFFHDAGACRWIMWWPACPERFWGITMRFTCR